MHRNVLAILGIMLCGIAHETAGAQRWTLSGSPTYEIGDEEGDTPLGFGSITGLVRIGGSIIVADGQSHRLVVVNPVTGAHRATGRFGGGPGEFRTVASLQRCHPTKAYVYDPGAMRLSIFAANGTFERALDVRDFSANGAPPYELACNAAGSILSVNRSPYPPAGIGPRRPTVALRVFVDSTRSWSAGRVHASERYFDGSSDFPRPLGLRTSVALGSAFWVVGTGETDSIAVYSLADSGAPVGAFSTALRRRPISPAMIRHFVDAQVHARIGRADTSAHRALYASMRFPERLPAYRRLLVGANDEIWIEHYPVPTDSEARWSVFTPQGKRLGELAVPASFQLEVVDESTVVGVWRGSDEVLRVRSYRYRRE